MYGIGLLRGMGVTLKNLAAPGRMFSVQYPDRRVGLFGLAKANDTNVLSLARGKAGRCAEGAGRAGDRFPRG